MDETLYKKFLGISVGLLQNGMRLSLKSLHEADTLLLQTQDLALTTARQHSYSLRCVFKRGHHYAIVDEVDSILIDEARTPLIISGAGTKSAEYYKDFAKAVRG